MQFQDESIFQEKIEDLLPGLYGLVGKRADKSHVKPMCFCNFVPLHGLFKVAVSSLQIINFLGTINARTEWYMILRQDLGNFRSHSPEISLHGKLRFEMLQLLSE